MEGENVAVVGPPKSGKSFLAIDLGLSLAANLPVVGKHAVKRSGHVIYLSGEGHAGMKRRFLAWGRRRGLSLAEIEALPFHYNKGVPLAAESIAEAQAFVDAIRRKIGADPVLVIIDTMARSLGALDENTAAAAAQYLALTEMLRDQLNCTTLTLAHATNKPGTKAIDFRGSSGFSAGFDSVWTLDKSDENATVEMRGKYFKDADDLGPFYFRLESLEDGGAVLVPAEPPARNGGIEGSFLVEHLRAAMIERGVAGWRNALTDEELAERLAGPEPDPDPAKSQEENAKAQSGWVVKVARQKKMLQTGAVGRPDRRGGRYSARYAGRFRDSIKYSQAMEAVGRELRISQQPGGRKPAVVRLWCVPDEEAEIPF
jgi:KaiC/GvpD/RAD55 family RecA-like ATPase